MCMLNLCTPCRGFIYNMSTNPISFLLNFHFISPYIYIVICMFLVMRKYCIFCLLTFTRELGFLYALATCTNSKQITM